MNSHCATIMIAAMLRFGNAFNAMPAMPTLPRSTTSRNCHTGGTVRSQHRPPLLHMTNTEFTSEVPVLEEKDRAKSDKEAFNSFDYSSQWYPVIWAQDLPLNQPTRVTLFDVDYVLAKTSTSEEKNQYAYYAMLDSCPHKKVALSEGRITASGNIQCSYHGWSFDGSTGKCVEIPQTLIAKNGKRTQSLSKEHAKSCMRTNEEKESNNLLASKKVKSRREDGTSVAVMEVQGMIWMQPSHTPLESLAALHEGTLLPPPRIPEIDMPGYKTTHAVRDFPIDWTVLMENIMDPDHGYFAHSSSNSALGFDWYSADGIDNVVGIEEQGCHGGWRIMSYVNAVEKLAKFNREVRVGNMGATKDKKIKEETPKLATTNFSAPSLIALGRRTNTTSTAAFVSAFWVCPTGTGKSRFMAASVSRAPFSIPRWLVHISLNNFLDQDTFLLCGQHRAVLKREAEGYLEVENKVLDGNVSQDTTNNVRKSTYVYRSPTERLPVRVGQFFDATLSRVPNRKEALMAWYNRNNDGNKVFESWPTREAILNRYDQHTKICPDSLDVVRRCDMMMKSSKVVGLVLTFMKISLQTPSESFQMTLQSPFGPTISGVGQLVSSISAFTCSLGARLLKKNTFYSILAVAALSHWVASRIKREFFFKFDEKTHHKDVKFISNNWMDL